jgi:membrane protein implicated in regulation of membrane protease activity
MELFWLFIGIAIVAVVTVMCFIEGWERWATSYALALIALCYYLIRRYMRKRMEKHQAFLNAQKDVPPAES